MARRRPRQRRKVPCPRKPAAPSVAASSPTTAGGSSASPLKQTGFEPSYHLRGCEQICLAGEGVGSGIERGRWGFCSGGDLPSAPWYADQTAASNRPCLVIPGTKFGENPVVCRACGRFKRGSTTLFSPLVAPVFVDAGGREECQKIIPGGGRPTCMRPARR